MATALKFDDGSTIEQLGVDLDAQYYYAKPCGSLELLPGLLVTHTSWGTLLKEELKEGFRLILFSFENGLFFGPTLPGTVSQAIELDDEIYLTVVHEGSHRLVSWNIEKQTLCYLSPGLGAIVLAVTKQKKLRIDIDHTLLGTRRYELFGNELPSFCQTMAAAETVTLRTLSGAEVIVLGDPMAQKTLLSFHGGPESYELLENRYDGLYLELLNQGYKVLVFNYAGSSGLGSKSRMAPWGHWEATLKADLGEVTNLLPMKKCTVFGASFGGALSLMAASHLEVQQVFLTSPLLDLKAQSLCDPSLNAFFNSRFSDLDFNTFTPHHLVSRVSCPISCIHADFDPVVSSQRSRAAAETFDHFRLSTPRSATHSLSSKWARRHWRL